jgi:hypothetical protein
LDIILELVAVLREHLRFLARAIPVVLHKRREGSLEIGTDQHLLQFRNDLVEDHIVSRTVEFYVK